MSEEAKDKINPEEPCPKCKGTGAIERNACSDCEGTGLKGKGVTPKED